MMANSFGRYGHKYTKRKHYLAFLQFKNTAVHDCASWPDRPGCAWDCLRQIIGNLTQNLQLWGSDMFLVASHEHSTEKSSSLNTILAFLWVAGDPLWSLVTVLGFCKILEYGTPAVCFWCSFSRFPTGIWFSSLFLAGHFFFVYCTKNSTFLLASSVIPAARHASVTSNMVAFSGWTSNSVVTWRISSAFHGCLASANPKSGSPKSSN